MTRVNQGTAMPQNAMQVSIGPLPSLFSFGEVKARAVFPKQ